MRILAGVLLCIASTWAQGLEVPGAGFVLDRTGNFRPLHGISHNFLAGDPLQSGILAASCGSLMCVLKTDSSLIVTNAAGMQIGDTVDAPHGPALVSVAGATALIYFAGTKQIAHLRNGVLEFVDWQIDGEVLGIDSNADLMVVRRPDGSWAVSPDGSVQSAFDPETTAVLLLSGATLQATASSLKLERPDGSRVDFDLPGITGIRKIGEHYAQVTTAGGSYALRLDGGREELSVLAEVAE